MTRWEEHKEKWNSIEKKIDMGALFFFLGVPLTILGIVIYSIV